jgi:uncharacterized protein (TIGR03066 family)
MKKLAVVAVACAALVFAGCSGPKEKIIGKWETKEKVGDKEMAMTMEFTKDGKVKMAMDPISIEGTYKWTDNDHIEITMKNPMTEKEDTTKLTVKKVDDKELVLVGKSMGSDKEEEKKFTKK